MTKGMWNCIVSFRDVPAKSLTNQTAVDDFGAYPEAPKFLGGFERRTAASERIEHDLPFVRGKFDTSAWDHGLQFVNAPTRLELSMTRGGRIIPKVCQVESKGI